MNNKKKILEDIVDEIRNIVDVEVLPKSIDEKKEVLPKPVDEKKEVKQKPLKLKIGVVKDVSFLRVRKAASTRSDILVEIKKGDIVYVDLEGSTESFYRIFLDPKTRRKEGFVVRDFVFIEEV